MPRCLMCGQEFTKGPTESFCSAACYWELDMVYDDAATLANQWRRRGSTPTEGHSAEVFDLATNNPRSWTGYLPGEAPDPLTWVP